MPPRSARVSTCGASSLRGGLLLLMRARVLAANGQLRAVEGVHSAIDVGVLRGPHGSRRGGCRRRCGRACVVTCTHYACV